jgi:membrane-associated phospholipid phosphatase
MACYGMHRGVGRAAAAWAVLIGVSTVYTKQHFAIDAIAGAIVGMAGWAIFQRKAFSDPVDECGRRLAPRRALAVVGAYAVAVTGFWIFYLVGAGPASR